MKYNKTSALSAKWVKKKFLKKAYKKVSAFKLDLLAQVNEDSVNCE